jgi:hypothetical protein
MAFVAQRFFHLGTRHGILPADFHGLAWNLPQVKASTDHEPYSGIRGEKVSILKRIYGMRTVMKNDNNNHRFPGFRKHPVLSTKSSLTDGSSQFQSIVSLYRANASQETLATCSGLSPKLPGMKTAKYIINLSTEPHVTNLFHVRLSVVSTTLTRG